MEQERESAASGESGKVGDLILVLSPRKRIMFRTRIGLLVKVY